MDLSAVVSAMNKKGFDARVFESADEIVREIAKIVPQNSTFGVGGSVTLKELEIPQKLVALGYTVNVAYTSDIPASELSRVNLTSKYYLSGTNALTEDGVLVNTDGRGNRIAAMAYGPEHVFIVAGSNKIVKTLDEAFDRVHNVAAPPNCVRLSKKTPCAVTGSCQNCASPDRICRATLVQTHPMSGQTCHVFLLDRSLGF